MPECDGPSATKRIRSFIKERIIEMGKRPRKREKPFICCLSAYIQENFKQEARKAGMNDYISKPLYKNKLV